jgi:hypothetical protein
MYYLHMSEQAMPHLTGATADGETAAALLADREARVRGKPVSPTQLARWHREGYIPKPTRPGLGRGRGSVSIYPPGTRAQLRALCRFLSKERDAEKVGWRLWWAGYPVPASFARKWLERAAQQWETLVAVLRDTRTPEQVEYGLLPDEAYDDLERAADVRLRRPFMRHLRTRVGRDNISTVFQVILQLAAGLFASLATHSAAEEGEKSEQQIMVEAFGLDQLARSELIPPTMDLAGDFEGKLRSFGDLIATAHPSRVLEEVRDRGLEQARADVQTIASALQSACRLLEQHLGRRRAPLVVDLDRAIAEMGPIDQAIWVVFWLTLRARGLGERLDGWVQAAKMWDAVAPLLRVVVAQAVVGESVIDTEESGREVVDVEHPNC